MLMLMLDNGQAAEAESSVWDTNTTQESLDGRRGGKAGMTGR